jgi:hypothetical protein
LFNKNVALFNKHVTVSGVSEIELLKSKYAQEIEKKLEEVRVLRAKLDQLTEFGNESKQLQNPSSVVAKYAHMGVTEAILNAVNSLVKTGRCPEGATAAQVKSYMLANGFRPKTQGSVFDISVSVILKRLKDSGRVSSRSSALGRRLYKPMPIGRSIR